MTSETTPTPPAPAATGPNGKADPEPKLKRPPTDGGTDYVVLERVEAKDGGAAWRPVGNQSTGAGSDAAIRQHRKGVDGTFKAVPVRSWKGGLTLRQEQQPVTVAEAFQD